MIQKNDRDQSQVVTSKDTRIITWAEIIWDELVKNRRIDRATFETRCNALAPESVTANYAVEDSLKPNPDDTKKKERGPGNLTSEFSRAVQPIYVTLKHLGIQVRISKDNTLEVPAGLGLSRGPYGLNAFRPGDDEGDKRYIGEMIANFLHDESMCDRDESVFLGSGSTVFHIGTQMCELCARKGKPYRQLFSTINVPLASLWCESESKPTDKLSIPRGVLETGTYRFETLWSDKLEKHRWFPSLAVVGCDGLHYDHSSESVWFYAKSESIAYNTNLFVQSATTTVFYCLASSKMKGGNNGPKLEPPPEHVVKVVVTGKETPLSAEIRKAFTERDYIIVTEEKDFKQIKEMRKKIEKKLKENKLKEAEEKETKG